MHILLPIGRICRPDPALMRLFSPVFAVAQKLLIRNVPLQDKPVRKMRVIFALLLGLTVALPPPARADVRIKDITDVEGIRENQLIGYGLVVGLNGTGDKLNNNVFTRESLIGMLERLGVNTRDQVTALSTKNIAAVMVTAAIAGFRPQRQPYRYLGVRLGRRHEPDRRHPAGDANARRGRRGLRGRPGTLSTGAIAARGAAASVTRGVPTSARIANGATVEKEVPFKLDKDHGLWLALRNPDLTTAQRMAAVINKTLGRDCQGNRSAGRCGWI